MCEDGKTNQIFLTFNTMISNKRRKYKVAIFLILQFYLTNCLPTVYWQITTLFWYSGILMKDKGKCRKWKSDTAIKSLFSFERLCSIYGLFLLNNVKV